MLYATKPWPIVDTVEGILIEGNVGHKANALSPIDVKPSGNVTVVKWSLELNALAAIVLRVVGNTTSFKNVFLITDHSPIDSTPFSNVTFSR